MALAPQRSAALLRPARASRLPRLAVRARASTTVQEAQPRTASVVVHIGAEATQQLAVPLEHPLARLIEAQIAFPLGLVLESDDGTAVVAEVTPGGAADGAGVRVGDVVRGSTAMMMQMVYPTTNLLFGGVGRPKLVKVLVPTSKLAFPKVLDAVRSNSAAAGGDDAIVLVLERIGDDADGADAGGEERQQAEQQREAVLAGASSGGGSGSSSAQAGAVFDPEIFQ